VDVALEVALALPVGVTEADTHAVADPVEEPVDDDVALAPPTPNRLERQANLRQAQMVVIDDGALWFKNSGMKIGKRR
jgi:hypothetical protein